MGTDHASISVELVDATGRVPAADLHWLEETVRRAIALQSLTGTLSARIVNDAAMATAHAEFCGVEGTTDVITFDLTDPEDNAPSKGMIETDLLLCLDEAERQAKSRGHETRRELLLYTLHGILHSLGHDDHEEDTYARMHAEEDRLLTALGIGPTFESGKPSGGGAS
jgi:probable rRNA maturation factor